MKILATIGVIAVSNMISNSFVVVIFKPDVVNGCGLLSAVCIVLGKATISKIVLTKKLNVLKDGTIIKGVTSNVAR